MAGQVRGRGQRGEKGLLQMTRIQHPKLTMIVPFFLMHAAAIAQPTVDQLVRQETLASYKECLWSGAEKLDDGTSDAATIGSAIAPQCRAALKNVVEVYTLGEPPEVVRLSYEKMVAAENQSATAAVLEVRRSRKAAR